MKTAIGIRREDKNQWEKRTPIIPSHAGEFINDHNIDIQVQPSSIRIFTDQDFQREGAWIKEDLSECQVIFALKEIPQNFFNKNKTYLFFSHTIKGQKHNMPMLKRMMELECTLIEYEKITNENGIRLVFFGTQAGKAGMIETLAAYGRRLAHEGIPNPFTAIEQPYVYQSLVEAKEIIKKVGWDIHEKGLPHSMVPLICGIAGYGHSSKGAQEILDLLPVEEIQARNMADFMKQKNFSSNRVYKIVFKEEDMVEPVSPGKKFDLQNYYSNPGHYRSIFDKYLPYLNILVNCIYWTEDYPRFVTKSSLRDLFTQEKSPNLKVIGDVSCDIQGSIECSLKITTPSEPVYVFDPLSERVTDGIEGRGVVVMTIDNLPAEIPLESSVFFSETLKPYVPQIARADYKTVFKKCQLPDPIKKAVILYQGELAPDFEYMKKFL
ncbi:MAG: hypothetical protein JW755_05335 [Candidatus Aminicenantes bacterium]|nr:hypothetical protein [Candidatus Aminicenantes bacterium]